nr:hypothetical protein MACL_00003472 [Theileria orientalis]
MGELIFDFKYETETHYNSDGGCQISAVSGSEDTIAVDSSSVIKNNEKLKRLELYYNKKPISEGTIEQTELDNEYEALHTTLTLNIKNGTCIFESSLDNTSTNSGISSIKFKGPTNVDHSYSFIFYDCEFSSKGFNQIRIENTDDDPYDFENFKGSDYNDVNLDKMRVYCSSDDLGRNLPLLIQFCSKSHYKFPDSRQTNTSNYYELYKAEEIKVETSKVEDGSTLSTETFYTFRKSYKKIESLMQTQLLEKLQFIYDSNNVVSYWVFLDSFAYLLES